MCATLCQHLPWWALGNPSDTGRCFPLWRSLMIFLLCWHTFTFWILHTINLVPKQLANSLDCTSNWMTVLTAAHFANLLSFHLVGCALVRNALVQNDLAPTLVSLFLFFWILLHRCCRSWSLGFGCLWFCCCETDLKLRRMAKDAKAGVTLFWKSGKTQLVGSFNDVWMEGMASVFHMSRGSRWHLTQTWTSLSSFHFLILLNVVVKTLVILLATPTRD